MVSAAEQLAANLNFGALGKAEELKKRIWFTLGALIVYRLGTYIPMPGINPQAFADAFQQAQGGILGLFNMFSGGAVSRMAIFALEEVLGGDDLALHAGDLGDLGDPPLAVALAADLDDQVDGRLDLLAHRLGRQLEPRHGDHVL
jgi:hypothetical protein